MWEIFIEFRIVHRFSIVFVMHWIELSMVCFFCPLKYARFPRDGFARL